ncbi:MAG: hypothetical protein V9G10_16760 [Candidatus Nanopelagicales bacterium]
MAAAQVAAKRVHEHHGRGVVRSQRGTGVEPEPAEPQQTRADHDQREVVRLHRRLRPAEPLAQDQGQRQTGRTGVDVDRGSSGEVDGRSAAQRAQALEDPAAGAPHPVRDREVDQRGPDPAEQDPRAELHAVGHRTGDQGDGDRREHRLEGGERHHRVDRCRVVGHHAAQPGKFCEAAEQAVAHVSAECQRVAVQHPQHADEEQRPHHHHHHVERGLRPRHAAVEECQAGQHEQYKGSAGENPGGVACTQDGLFHRHASPFGCRLLPMPKASLRRVTQPPR